MAATAAESPLDALRRQYLELSTLHFMALRLGCYRTAERAWPLLGRARELLVSAGGMQAC